MKRNKDLLSEPLTTIPRVARKGLSKKKKKDSRDKKIILVISQYVRHVQESKSIATEQLRMEGKRTKNSISRSIEIISRLWSCKKGTRLQTEVTINAYEKTLPWSCLGHILRYIYWEDPSLPSVSKALKNWHSCVPKKIIRPNPGLSNLGDWNLHLTTELPTEKKSPKFDSSSPKLEEEAKQEFFQIQQKHNQNRFYRG